jgi:hypothetical protein
MGLDGADVGDPVGHARAEADGVFVRRQKCTGALSVYSGEVLVLSSQAQAAGRRGTILLDVDDDMRILFKTGDGHYYTQF